MTQVRKIVDSSSLTDIFDLPPNFMNRKVEVIMFPVEETADITPKYNMEQTIKWSKSPKVQDLVGVLEGVGLPADISMKDIRQMRLAEKYKI
ncbi:MAG: hypothetical protein LBI28_09175 [Treponema sp.]|jgi:hypothetical protein|nr:hypothetical protein [Treponema sp.]